MFRKQLLALCIRTGPPGTPHFFSKGGGSMLASTRAHPTTLPCVTCRSSPISSWDKCRVALIPLCSASHVLPWIMGTTSLLVALAPRLGGFGVPNFFQVFFAVAVTRRLRLMLHLGRVPQACWLCAYARGSGPPGTPHFFQRRGQHADAG